MLRVPDCLFLQDMIKMHVKTTAATDEQSANTPADFIQNLNDPSLRGEDRAALFEKLRVSLNSKPVSWVQEFGVDGLSCIVKVMRFFRFSLHFVRPYVS